MKVICINTNGLNKTTANALLLIRGNNGKIPQFTIGRTYEKILYGIYKQEEYHSISDDEDFIGYYKESTIGRLFGSGSADTNKLLEYFSETSAFIIKNLFDLYENCKIIFAKIIEVSTSFV